MEALTLTHTSENLVKLEDLDIADSMITGVGLKKILTELPNIQAVNIRGCTIISADAVQWGREWAKRRGAKLLWDLSL